MVSFESIKGKVLGGLQTTEKTYKVVKDKYGLNKTVTTKKKCPNCKHLGSVEKGTHGSYPNKLGVTYKCDNCGHGWK